MLEEKAPIVTDYVKLWIEKGVIYFEYPPDSIITLDIAKKVVKLRLEYTEGVTYPGLSDIRGLKKAEYDAMKYWATKEAYESLSAIAVFTNNRLHKMFFNFYFLVAKPYKPCKYFTDISSAYKFLSVFRFLN